MTRVAMWPVVAADHPLAALPLPLAREALEPHVQLVLTDRTPLTQNLSGGIVSRHIWRFADLATRLDFLLGRLRLVQHAKPHGRRACRRGPAEEASDRQPGGNRPAALGRA